MEGYFSSGLFNFLFGFFAGIIYGWNKKILFWVVLGLMGIMLIGVLYLGDEIEKGFNILRFISGVILSTVGMWTGMLLFKSVFEEKE